MPDGCTPLIAAAAFGRSQVCEVLLVAGASLRSGVRGNGVIGCGGTAAEVARANGHAGLAAHLYFLEEDCG